MQEILSSRRIIGLDLLRAVAILMVIVCHGTYIFYEVLNVFIANVLISIYGHFGVTLFFVLSGFLVGKIFLRDIVLKDNYSINHILNFWIRRWFRTIPNYILFLILYVLVSFAVFNSVEYNRAHFGGQLNTSVPILKYLFFSQNLVQEVPSFFGQSWSLAVEEWFYLLLPLPFTHLLFKKFNKKIILLILLSILFLFQLWKLLVLIAIPDFFNEFKVVFNLDNILVGVILAYIYLHNKELLESIKWQLLFIGFGLFVFSHFLYIRYIITSVPNLGIQVFAPVVTSLSFAFMFPFFIKFHAKGKVARVIKIISLSSYSLYLSHFLVLIFFVDNWLIQLFPDPTSFFRLLAFCIYLVINVALAYMIYIYFEVPIMNLRDKSMIKKLVYRRKVIPLIQKNAPELNTSNVWKRERV